MFNFTLFHKKVPRFYLEVIKCEKWSKQNFSLLTRNKQHAMYHSDEKSDKCELILTITAKNCLRKCDNFLEGIGPSRLNRAAWAELNLVSLNFSSFDLCPFIKRALLFLTECTILNCFPGHFICLYMRTCGSLCTVNSRNYLKLSAATLSPEDIKVCSVVCLETMYCGSRPTMNDANSVNKKKLILCVEYSSKNR